MTSVAIRADDAGTLPDYAPTPRSAPGPAFNDQGYYVGGVERNLYRVTDGAYQSAFLITDEGVVRSNPTEGRSCVGTAISTLLTRNLFDVFGEMDPARRRAAIDEIFTEDCVFYDPRGGVYRGRDAIDRVAGELKATRPDFRYQPIAEPQELGNGGRIEWVAGRPGEAPAAAGTDFIIAQDGRIAAVYLFFDKLP